MKAFGWLVGLRRLTARRGSRFDPIGLGFSTRALASGRAVAFAAAAAVLGLVVAVGLSFTPAQARGSEAAAEEPLGPTAAQTKEFLESESLGELTGEPTTDPEAAEELPHRDLNGEEALELAEAVFEPELEAPAGVYGGLEPEKFLSNFAAVVPASTLPEDPDESGGGLAAERPRLPVLIESTLPLRTENAEGEEEPVDLGLQSPEGSGGELRPRNPLTELAIPAHLGEGITVGEVGIGVGGAAGERAPTNVEGGYAFYPNVAENTDLVVAPTPTGVETMTDIRSAEAPTATTYELSLPAGSELRSDGNGGAEVLEGQKTILRIPSPSALDAAGEPVPSELTIEGDAFTVSTRPDPSTAFPVLVDPIIVYEGWQWSSAHESLAAWTGTSTNWSAMQPVPYALWAGYPGLDLSSGIGGNAAAGTQATWEYWVPRYKEDLANFGSAPTSWVFQMSSQGGVQFVPWGNYAVYPALVLGLVIPGVGYQAAWIHAGNEGELNNWAAQYVVTNTTSQPTVKGANMDLVTNEYEAPSKRRDAYLPGAYIAVVDEAPPVVKTLTSPTGWMNTAAAPIPYEFEDTGLGIFDVAMSYEGSVMVGTGVNPLCYGTAISPCPRIVTSGTGGPGKAALGNLAYEPAKLPTGLDTVTVMAADPLASTGDNTHEASGTVLLKVDHTPPVVRLSGALTEEEKLGTAKSEYPLTISATDGTESSPQSGIAGVEVKVDGKKVTMANETPWHPNCTTQNCPFSGTWTLKASEFATGSHEVEVVATDAAGVVSTTPLEVDLGKGPPQTGFTTSHPTYEDHQVGEVGFKATRGGTVVPGATFKCALGGAGEAPTPSEPCTSPLKLPEHLEKGWHTFVVAATSEGASDPTPARWRFNTGEYPPAPETEKLVFPEVGKKTASWYTLEAEWGPAPEGKAAQGVTGVTFEMELPGTTIKEGKEVPKTFEQVPAECVVDGQGRQVSWPIPVHDNPGHDAPVYLKVRGCPAFEKAKYPEKEIQFRAVFDGGEKVAGASAPVSTEFIYDTNLTRVPTDAVEQVGPASVDLLTGAFTLSHTDVSIPVPGYEANLEFTRVFKSTQDGKTPGFSVVLGGAWQPSLPLESEGEGEAWTRIEEVTVPAQAAVYGKECWNPKGETVVCGSGCPSESCEEWLEEPAQPAEHWIELVDNEGAGVSFEEPGVGTYVAPDYAKELKLTREGANFVLAYPNGTRTSFVPDEQGHWVPKVISYQATPGSMRMVYEMHGKELRLEKEIAPSQVECGNTNSIITPGCRTLEFRYEGRTLKGGGGVTLLNSIVYWGPSGVYAEAQIVAVYGYEEVLNPGGGAGIVLIGEADPRLPKLGTSYTYASAPYSDELTSVSVPGEEPWTFGYEYNAGGYPNPGEKPTRLKSVGRGGLTTTIAYEVPVSGSGAPYAMSPEAVAGWGQSDLPVDATAIFPPTHVPSEYPPHGYTGATVHYMDPEGRQVNVASPSPPGVSGASIATSETNVKGDVVRELGPRARLIALESPESASVSHQLDSHSVYNQAGTELLESWGPLHQVRLESGESVQAREHTVTHYDEAEPTPPAGTPPAYLPTKEMVATLVPATGGELESKVTETHYNWTLRKPNETVIDPGGLNIRSVTVYWATGQTFETRQPKNAEKSGAGSTQIFYYSAGSGGECLSNQYAGLPCKVLPAAQAEGTGRPKLLVKKFTAYDYLDQPTEVLESPGGTTAESETRRTTTSYDLAGRVVTRRTSGGGASIPKTEMLYDESTGLPVEQRFVCPGSEAECKSFDPQETAVAYNSLGQVKRYLDADGNLTETTYDAYGRPVTVNDARGTQTLHYDETSGVLTSMEVSGVGTFTAHYDADGDLTEQGLPNGLTRKTTYNVADEPTSLAYTKTSSCGESCTWYEETLERSAEGGIVADSGSLVSNRYTYDHAGRLKEATETPTGGQCTSRAYAYDADSNRLTKTTRSPGVGGACSTSGGTTQSYEYDEADRLKGTGLVYDAWGRIESLPAEFAGGKALTTTYFANDMVATQAQNGVTNTFQLDATGRQRQREQTGGVTGTEIFHYDGPGDSPSWTALGSTWSRNIAGIGGELAAIQESTGTTTYKLTDLHGDVVASASSSPTITKLLATYRADEFGEPVYGSTGRFGWLGGKSRRTELSSGVIQMGVRSYIPQIGRFLSPDPVPGGSANPYDYANANPVTGFDLLGESPSAHACYESSIGCECKLWAHLKKGARKGTVTLTVVQKCNRFGGISKRGEEVRWESRTPHGSYHSIPPPAPVYPSLKPACIGNANACQNDVQSETTLHCEPGKEIQYTDVWAFQFNYQGNGEIHNLTVTIQQTCPG